MLKFYYLDANILSFITLLFIYSLQFELYVNAFKLLKKEMFLCLRDMFIFVELKKGKVMYANVNI